MKVGIEVEGRLRGVRTLFCSASDNINKAVGEAILNGIGHVYVSDNDNTLSYQVFGDYPDILFTLDITCVQNIPRPSNVTLMLRLPGFEDVSALKADDQIKFEHNRTVLVASVNSLVRTNPDEFENDIEVEL